MALVACLECRSEISDKASFCPKCGHPVQENLQSRSSSQEVPINFSELKFDNSRDAKKSRGNKTVSITIIVFSLLVILIAVAYLFYIRGFFEHGDQDSTAAEESSSIQDRQSALPDHPGGNNEAVSNSIDSVKDDKSNEFSLNDFVGQWCGKGRFSDEADDAGEVFARVSFDGDNYSYFGNIVVNGIVIENWKEFASCNASELEISTDGGSVGGVFCEGKPGVGIYINKETNKKFILFGKSIIESLSNCEDYFNIKDLSSDELIVNKCKAASMAHDIVVSDNSPDYCHSVVDTLRATFVSACVAMGGPDGGEHYPPMAVMHIRKNLAESIPSQCY